MIVSQEVKTHYSDTRKRYIGAYLVIECFSDVKIPIINVNVTAVAHTPAVASVHVHPNPFIHKLTRGINMFVVCQISEDGVDAYPKNYVMFIGEVSSIQTSSNSSRTEYVINMVDNRRYISELPTYYLKMIRTKGYDDNINIATENNKSVFAMYDEAADANFYGVEGQYLLDTFWYKINDATKVYGFMQEWYGGSLERYINKMLDPLKEKTGWEPYYVNMNKKKRIVWHTTIVDTGIFRSDISASFYEAASMGAIASIKNAHAELNTTYEDALNRLSELGYMFNTNLFPSMLGGAIYPKNADGGGDIPVPDNIDSEIGIIEYIKSCLFYGKLVGIVSVNDDDKDPIIPDNTKQYITGTACTQSAGEYLKLYRYAELPAIYVLKHQQTRKTYYAIVNLEVDDKGNISDKPARINEYLVIPKLYGVIPPRCNWGVVDEGITFNCIINEPPLTALKYNLVDGKSGVSMFSYAYPGGLTLIPQQSMLGKKDQSYVYVDGTVIPKTRPGDKLYVGTGQTITSTSKHHINRRKSDASGGTDIAMEEGSYIPSYTSGTVVHVYYDPNARNNDATTNGGWGNQVMINSVGPSGVFTWSYNHLGTVLVRNGDQVKPGQVIGSCGSTGNSTGSHFHLSIKGPKGYINSTYLFRNADGPNSVPRDIVRGKIRIPGYDLYQITSDAYVSTGIIIKDEGRVVSTGDTLNDGKKDLYGPHQHFTSPQYPYADENVYGIKRVCNKGNGLYELEKVFEYLDGVEPGKQVPTMTPENKIDMLKSKVVQDYHESRVSRNTGTLSIQGMNEFVMVGFPYILYHPKLDIFYYGFVEEVSHKVDNSNGSAYTEISLSAVTTAYSIGEIEKMFSGYTKKKYVGEAGLDALNEIYANVSGVGIKKEEYGLFNLSPYTNNIESDSLPGVSKQKVKLLNIMTNGMNYRNICTIERLQNYMYGNKKSVHTWNDVSGTVCTKGNQWMSEQMKDTVDNIIKDYSNKLRTNASINMNAVNTTDEGEAPPVVDESIKEVIQDAVSFVDSYGKDSTDYTGWEEKDEQPQDATK